MCRRAVAGVVRKLMAKRPEDRYQTPAELVADLSGKVGRLAKAAPPANRPLDGSPQSGKPRRKRKWAWIAGGVAGALLLVVTLSKIGSSGETDPKTSNPVSSSGKPTGTKPTQPESRYVKMPTREETILATLKSAGLPTLDGKWYAMGFFDYDKSKGPDTACNPPETGNRPGQIVSRQAKQAGCLEGTLPEFQPGRVRARFTRA